MKISISRLAGDCECGWLRYGMIVDGECGWLGYGMDGDGEWAET